MRVISGRTHFKEKACFFVAVKLALCVCVPPLLPDHRIKDNFESSLMGDIWWESFEEYCVDRLHLCRERKLKTTTLKSRLCLVPDNVQRLRHKLEGKHIV
jgi:hypothetical protein